VPHRLKFLCFFRSHAFSRRQGNCGRIDKNNDYGSSGNPGADLLPTGRADETDEVPLGDVFSGSYPGAKRTQMSVGGFKGAAVANFYYVSETAVISGKTDESIRGGVYRRSSRRGIINAEMGADNTQNRMHPMEGKSR